MSIRIEFEAMNNWDEEQSTELYDLLRELMYSHYKFKSIRIKETGATKRIIVRISKK